MMKNLFKFASLSIFIIFLSFFSDISTISAYSVNISWHNPGSSLVPSAGYPIQTSNAQSIAYNGTAQVKWTTVGMSSCVCKYWDFFAQQEKICTPSGNTVGANILSGFMPNLKNTVVDYGSFTSNWLKLECTPTPCIAGSTGLLASSGSWTVPNLNNTQYDNCNFKFEAWGGGGGGHGGHGDTIGGSGADGGAGGGAGGYAQKTFTAGSLASGQTIGYTIGTGGAGGAGGASGNNAGNIGITGLDTTISFPGGYFIKGGYGGGAVDINGYGVGGTAGVASSNYPSTSVTLINGGNGAVYNSNYSQFGGDGGSSPNGGIGGAAHGNNGNNSNGNTGDNGGAPGAGGAGGGGADGGVGAHSGGHGGDGSGGGVTISWF